MEPKTITTENITFPEVEKLHADTRSELLDSARRDGKYTGLKNIPELGDATCAAHLSPLKAQAEQKRSAALTILQPDMHISAIERIEAKLEEDTREINSRNAELGNLNDVEHRELDGKRPPEKRKSNLFGWILLAVIAITDLALNAGALEAAGDSLGYAISIAVGMAIGTFALAKGIVYCFRRAFGGDRKWFAFAGVAALVALGGFWVLSGFRSNAMAINGANGSSPIGFWVLNLFFFAAAIFISVMFFPADRQSAEDRELARRFALIKEREEEIKALKAKLDGLKEAAAEERRKHLAILSYTVHTMNRIRAIYFEAVAIWKSTNLLCRPDRSMPVSFSEPIPDLEPLQFDLPPALNLSAA